MDALIGYTEKRAHPRQRVNKDATVTLPVENRLVQVKIEDISATGAGLRVDPSARLPAEFDLLVLGEQKLYRVAVRWRKGGRMGVEFLGLPRQTLSAL